MVCSYFDDHLAEILSHNHSADLNTTESDQMESSRARNVSQGNINAASSGSFQSQPPSPQLLSNTELLKTVFTLPIMSTSSDYQDLHPPIKQQKNRRKITTFMKITAYYKTSNSFCHTETANRSEDQQENAPRRQTACPPVLCMCETVAAC